MKWLGLLVIVGAVVAVCGCGNDETVVRLKEVPEIDHSAIDQYMDFENAEIGQEGLMVIVHGKAKVALGVGLPVRVDRFKGGTRLDDVNAVIIQAKVVAAVSAPPPEGVPDTVQVPIGPPAPPGPPPGAGIPENIEPGDPVQIVINATIEGGRLSKLVIKADMPPMPVPVGPGQ